MNSNRRLFWLSFFIAAIAVLFGWSAAENTADLRTCELSIGAINNADARVDIRRVTTSAFSRVIRIDYDLTPPNRTQAFSRFVICHFSVEQTPPFRSGLSALTTESGPLPEANLFMLKRFYLDTSETNSAKVPSVQASDATGFLAGIAHMAEWLLSVASQASLLALLAFCFLATLNLRRDVPPSIAYGFIIALVTSLGALATTGMVTRVAPGLALLAGTANASSVLILYIKSDEDWMRLTSPRSFPWYLFGILVAMALFKFPAQGVFGPHWLPPFLLRPFSLFTIAGYTLSTTPLALGLIGLAAFAAFLIPAPSQKKKIGVLQGNIIFLGLMAISGIVSACGYLQFGLGFNPLLLATKALLITLAARAAPVRSRGLQILLSSLALISVEYALAPFLAKPVVDLISYGLLFLLMAFTKMRQPEVPPRNPPESP